MTITTEDLKSVTQSVWTTMLETELDALPSALPSAVQASHVGVIRLAGAFDGMVSLHLAENLVRGAASVMFGLAVQDVAEDHVRDAVAELTNMVGGNVKCLVAQPTQLALPEVYTPEEAEEALPSTQPHAGMTFVGTSGELAVIVHQVNTA